MHWRRLLRGPPRRLFRCPGTQTQILGTVHPHLFSSLRRCPAKRLALGQGLCRSRRWGHLCWRLQLWLPQARQSRPLHRRSPGCSCRRCRLLRRRLPARHLWPLRPRFQGCSCRYPPKCRSRQRCRWRPRKQALQASWRQKALIKFPIRPLRPVHRLPCLLLQRELLRRRRLQWWGLGQGLRRNRLLRRWRGSRLRCRPQQARPHSRWAQDLRQRLRSQSRD